MDLEKVSIERLKMASIVSEKFYKEPLLILYSGGKDSEVILRLAEKSGINYEVMHSLTTADAPETVRHIRRKFYEQELKGIKCHIEMPLYKEKRTSMWNLIPQKGMPPTRLMRYCCSILKENGGVNRAVVTGVRKAESVKRKNRDLLETVKNKASEKNSITTDEDLKTMLNNDNNEKRRIIEHCQMKGKIVNNVIVDWSDENIWDFINSEKIELNPLYCNGFNRVGCIGCPIAGKKGRQKEFYLYPKYEKMYINAFQKNA